MPGPTTPAEFEKWLKGQLPAFKLRLEAIKELEKLANDSVKAGDQPRLADAIQRSNKPSELPTPQVIQANLAKFGKGNAALQKIVVELITIDKQVQATKARIQNTKISTTPPTKPGKAYVKTLINSFSVKAMAGIDPLIERIGPGMILSKVEENINRSSKLTTKSPTNKNAQSFSLDGKLMLYSMTSDSVRGTMKMSFNNGSNNSPIGSANSVVKIPTKNADKDTVKVIIQIVDDVMSKVIRELEKLVP